MTSEITLQGKVVVVTGSSRGIGAAIASAVAEAGASVVLASRKQEGLDEVAEQIRAKGGTALPIATHTGHPEAVVKGYFNMVRAFANRAKGGSIVNIASVMGMRAAPFQGVYGMTKAAVISMTQTLSLELGPGDIRINAIAPGLVETKFAQMLIEDDTLRDIFVARTALQRHAQPDEIAGAAVFLLSDAASYMTGQVMVIDGGMTAT